jgi:hypothetical protein
MAERRPKSLIFRSVIDHQDLDVTQLQDRLGNSIQHPGDRLLGVVCNDEDQESRSDPVVSRAFHSIERNDALRTL